jgi:hypothetical protein
MAVFKTILVILFAFIVGLRVFSQTVTNGNFSSGSMGWGCNPEASFTETTYGGSNNTNIVAEVDEEVGLCQTISGFTIGSNYSISFQTSRRTTCGPTFQSVKLKINNGALNVNVSRNGGGFNWGLETFYFVATSTTHTITLTSNTTGTCNLVFDNINLTLINALPIELVDFSALLKDDRTVDLIWQTASEKDNDYFTIERSIDGENWVALKEIDGAGNSTNLLYYATTDVLSEKGIFYYRLKQTDIDGAFTYSAIRAVVNYNSTHEISLFPNPTTETFTFIGSKEKDAPLLYTTMGTASVEVIIVPTNDGFIYDISRLANGIYFLKSARETFKVVKH